MVLLVASDTHGHADRLLTAVSRVRPAAVLFLGDGLSDLSVLPSELPVRAVRGNCDFFGREFPTCRLEVFGQTRIFLTHGHTLGVKGGPEHALAAALSENADILLYGHTHVPFEKNLLPGTEIFCNGRMEKLTRPLLILCPGSLGEPRNGAPSFATLTLRPDGILPGFGEL